MINRIITKFVRELTHPTRIEETELGDLYADALRETLGLIIHLKDVTTKGV